MEEIMVLRSFERILAVLIGGIAIYLGYLLFVRIPEHSEGEGKIEFPGRLSVYVARVGPGVFFALFGALVVGISFYQSVIIATGDKDGVAVFSGFSSQQEVSPNPVKLTDKRIELRQQVEFLNRLPSIIRDNLSEADRREVAAGMRETKLLLMQQIWSDDWGHFEEFRLWAEEGEPDPVPERLSAAAKYFRAGQEKHP